MHARQSRTGGGTGGGTEGSTGGGGQRESIAQLRSKRNSRDWRPQRRTGPKRGEGAAGDSIDHQEGRCLWHSECGSCCTGTRQRASVAAVTTATTALAAVALQIGQHGHEEHLCETHDSGNNVGCLRHGSPDASATCLARRQVGGRHPCRSRRHAPQRQ